MDKNIVLKNASPKVSVIMGVYNMANKRDMLYTAIQSILDQTYKDFEFIICDDGSVDDTYECLVQIAKEDVRMVLLRNVQNEGLAATLNTCIQNAKGEFIARMDADDISLHTRLEKEIAFLEKNSKFALVGCCINLFNDSGIWAKKVLPETPVRESFLFNSPFVHPSIVMRKKIYDELGGYRVADETLRAEDYDLFMRLYAAGYQGYNLQEVLFLYREDKSSYKKRKYKYRLDEAKVRYKGFKKLGLFPKGILYVIKPLLVGLLPTTIINKLKY